MAALKQRAGWSERGFTMIEVIVALVIVGMIASSASMVMGQMFRVNASSTSRITVIRQVQNAGSYISNDIQTAREVVIDPGATGFPLVITWTDWDTATAYRAEYYITAQKELFRHYTAMLGEATVQETTTLVSACLDLTGTPPNTLFRRVQGTERFSLKVTAVLPGYPVDVRETRTYEMLPRPKA
jgi:prepilin-type N-terminal cleavage/methylation domain-containing protein